MRAPTPTSFLNTERSAAEHPLANRLYGVFLAGETVEDCNEALCRALGVARDQLIGKSALDLSPPIQADGALSPERWQRREHAARAGMPQWFQWQFLKGDGSSAHTLVHLSAASGGRAGHLLAQVHDLSLLRGAGWAQQESAARLRDVLENTKAVIFAKDREGRYIFANHELERAVRRPASEIVGRTDYEIWPTELAERFRSSDLKVIEQAQALEFEVTDVVGDRQRTFRSFKFPLFDSEGMPYAVCGIGIDVSDRKRLEDALHSSALAVSSAQGPTVFQELVRFLATTLKVDCAFIAAPAEGNPFGMHMFAFFLDGRVHENFDYVITGTPCETVLYKSFRIYPSRLRESFPADADFGKLGFESYAGFPLTGSSGRSLGLISVVSRAAMLDGDFVESVLKIFAARAAAELERVQSEDALRASEEQYRQVFNASVDGLVLKDASHRIVDVNEAFLSMHGYRRDELVGRRLSDFIPPALQARCEVLLPGILAGEPCHIEALSQRRDGNTFPVEIHGVPMQYRGRPHALVIMRDITEADRAASEHAWLEAQLRQAQKMEAIGHLTGGIAHDFNNLLTTIMGYIVLANERPAVASDSRLSAYLEQAQRSCERARDLIQQMLTFSRGQRGTPRPLSLPSLVEESVRLFRPSLPSTLEIETDLSQEVSAVMLDPVHIDQVLLNLCLNARDAMSSVGNIRVTVREASGSHGICTACRNSVDGTRVELCVEDDGPGIPTAILDRIFEPFFTTKEVGRGSGMGLATVHGIVHEHGGHVIVETAPGEGARFRVMFPPLGAGGSDARAARLETARRVHSPRAPLRGRVMVVDDEASVAEFMRDLLQAWGLEVTVARDGLQARETVSRDLGCVDLVITDQVMPRITGLELARELLAMRPGLPILLYTGYSDGIDESDIANAGIRAMLRKPIDPDAVHRLLARHLAPPASRQ